MIHHHARPSAPLRACDCGHDQPRLIEARGRASASDPRLLGLPARQYHVECGRCGAVTVPTFRAADAEARWADNSRAQLADVQHLAAMHAGNERALIVQAAA